LKHETISLEAACTRVTGKRADVTLLCDVRQGTRPWVRARLDDLSQSGFRIAWFPGCSADLVIRIRIPGMQLLSANVRWQEGKAIGCSFTEPLHIAVFDHLVRQAHGIR
jgi:hypothetical protein